MAENQTHFSIRVTDQADGPEGQVIQNHLRAEVELEFGAADRQSFLAVVEDSNHEICAGLRGFSHWSWLYINQLWTSKSHRSSGLGQKLIAAAEAEAHKRGLSGLYVDTFSDRARQFYLRNGFEEFGKIAGFPPGFSRYFLKKEPLAKL